MITIDHLGIAVKSLEAARKLYEQLGLRVVGEEVMEHEQVKVAMVPMGESRVELLEPTSADSTVGRFLAKRGEGLHHVALSVPNVAEAVEQLKKSGTRFVSEEIKVGAGGHLYVFVHPSSAGGVLLELCQDPVSPA
jgi:methylmalonyl-CoA/ethylmalonyl-CoA epimerase